jgi:hypothetical protein
MDANTKKYLKVGAFVVLALIGYRMLMRKINKPSEEEMSSLDKDMVLQKGSKGAEVFELQRRLKEDFDKYLGETGIDADGIDGDFGSLTENALFEAKGVKQITLNQL